MLKRFCSALLLLACSVTSTFAQTSAVRIVVPYPTGGGTDVLARSIGAELAIALGRPVIIENKPGASGTIGAGSVASAAPDGRTVLFTSLIPTHHWYGKPESAQNLLPMFFAARAPFLVVTHPAVEAKSLRDLVAMSQQKPQTVTIGSPGSASPPHIASELFRVTAKTEFLAVPYKGAGPVIQDLTAGHLHVAFMTAGAVESLVSTGRLKALAVTSSTRIPTQPAIPTVIESGFPDFEVANSFGAFVPVGTPTQIVMELNAAFNKALRSPEVLKRLAAHGYEPVGGTPMDHQAAMRSDMKRIEALIAAGSLTFE